MPTIQSKDCHRLLPSGRSSDSERTASTVTVIGLCLAKACSQEGILGTGTKIELANTKGNTQTKPATCAVSISFTSRPIVAEIQENANPNSTDNAIAARLSNILPWKRNPMRYPTPVIRQTTNTFRPISE